MYVVAARMTWALDVVDSMPELRCLLRTNPPSAFKILMLDLGRHTSVVTLSCCIASAAAARYHTMQEMEPVHLEQQLELRQQQLQEIAGTFRVSGVCSP